MWCFTTKRNLKKHNKINHKQQRKFECNECDKVYSEEWKLKANEKGHKKYQCDQCNISIFKYKRYTHEDNTWENEISLPFI